jgi:2-dehydropantoate 2-reductase
LCLEHVQRRLTASQPQNNIHVSLICRSNYGVVAKSGVRLKTHTFGDYVFKPHAVYSSIQDAASSLEAPKDGWDYVIVSTKALPDITDDARNIEPLIRKAPEARTCVVLIQNGVGIEEPHRLLFPRNPIVSAVTFITVEQISPGIVRQNRWTRISLGSYSDGLGAKTSEVMALQQRGDECVQELVELFKRIGKLRDAEQYDELKMQHMRWHKVAINASVNPSAVLSGGLDNVAMVTDPALRGHIKACMEEVFAAAPKILGQPFPSDLASPEAILKSTERNPGSRPSMLMDWEHGRPMELEVILGNPVRIGEEHGVEMPRLQSMYALLRSMQRERDKRGREAKI